MTDVLTRHNSLMEKIIMEYGAMIRSAIDKALGSVPHVDDIVAEVHFAVFTTLRKLGEGWTPTRSFISTTCGACFTCISSLEASWRASSLETLTSSPTRIIPTPSSLAASTAPLTTAPGAKSPPMASTAILIGFPVD